jgi:hypothetical protein
MRRLKSVGSRRRQRKRPVTHVSASAECSPARFIAFNALENIRGCIAFNVFGNVCVFLFGSFAHSRVPSALLVSKVSAFF